LADLAGLGFDAEWCLASASEVGAAHQRRRLFVLAVANSPDLDAPRDGRDEGRPESTGVVRRSDVALRRDAAADTESVGHGDARPASVGGVGGRPTAVASRPVAEWGDYAPAIDRWARVLGRPAPAPTEPGRDGRPCLSPVFGEWLMGLPAGHVAGVPGLSRDAQLKALGNGVVPQQGAAALAHLIARIETAA